MVTSDSDRATLSVFISSPADVRPERRIAERIVQRLDREFSHWFRVEAAMWEREPLVASHHFQEKIIPPHETHIIVVILWSRLGLTLPAEKFLGPLSRKPVTGTEWEFEDALKSHRERKSPDILVYRKVLPVTSILNDRSAVHDRLTQMDKVDTFFKKWFINEKEQTPSAASWSFQDTTEFEEMLETHLRELIRRRANKLVDVGNDDERNRSPHYLGNPYRGLLAFELEHSGVFFGRTRARNDLRNVLIRQIERGTAFVLVFGASGSGKSSLVKAGVLADLKLPGMVGRVGLVRHTVFRPSDGSGQLLEALAAAIIVPEEALPELGTAPFHETVQSFAELLHSAPLHAARPIRQGLTIAGQKAELSNAGEARLLVVIDQLEELFTQEKISAAERDAFVVALEALSQSGIVWIIATMRSDFFDRLEMNPKLALLSKGEGRFVVLPPTDAEIGQMVRQPAHEANLRFEFDTRRGLGLDEVIRQAAAAERGSLPLLSFLLDQLWRRRAAGGLLTFSAYEDLGGLEGAVGRRAEEVFAEQGEDVQRELVPLLRALVTVKGGKATARSAPLSSITGRSPREVLVRAFLQSNARLLVADDDSGQPHLRLAHEALLTHWPRARMQVAADARDLELRGRLEQEAQAWREALPKHKSSLVRASGFPLAEAVALCGRWGEELPGAIIEFVNASKDVARRRRLRFIVTVSAAVTSLPIVVALSWLVLVWWGVRSVEAEMRFAQIPAGCFEMGSPETEQGRDANEGPVHGVCVKAFEMGSFEVTQGQWRRVMHQNRSPSQFNADDRLPVETVSWNEVQTFAWLMSMFGSAQYRLPTEAEWEYAVRAGTTTSRYWGDRAEDGCAYENIADLSLRQNNRDAIVVDCSDGQPVTAIVGSYKPNPFGLYDMLGNVAEWVQDCYVENYVNTPVDGSAYRSKDCPFLVVRGGSWGDTPRAARSAYRYGGSGGNRNGSSPDSHDSWVGFRIAKGVLD
jgi:formylglycine-generating enzyme required for sulfatase activity